MRTAVRQLASARRVRPKRSTQSSMRAADAVVDFERFLHDAGVLFKTLAEGAGGLDATTYSQDCMDAAAVALSGGGGAHFRPKQLAWLTVPGSVGQGACLCPECADDRCPGNTISVRADDSAILLRFVHSKTR